MNIVSRIQQQCHLAKVYAEDGALHTAAGILDAVATEVRQLAVAADRFIAAMGDDDPINLAGSGPVPSEPREG